MADEVGNHLSQVRRLQVKARSIVEAQWTRSGDPLGTARALSVAWYVHGYVRHVAPQLLVSVELVRPATGEQVWAKRFTRSDADVFAAQAEIAESVAAVVIGRLAPEERAALARRPTRNNDAYRLCLYANALYDRRTPADARHAVTAYAQALRLDPRFASAWAGLGRTRLLQYSWNFSDSLPRDSLLSLGRAFAERAVVLDSASADAWLALGWARFWDGAYADARSAYERSLRLDSLNAETFDAYAVLYSPWGLDLDSLATALYRRALALDPRLWKSWTQLGAVVAQSGRLDLAESLLDSAVALGAAPARTGRAYIRFLRRNAAGTMDDVAAAERDGVQPPRMRALYSVLNGDSTPARSFLAHLQTDSGMPDYRGIATFSIGLGMREEALVALQQLSVAGDPKEPRCSRAAACSSSIQAWRALHDPIFAPLRADPRYDALLERSRPRVPWLAPPP